MRVTNTMSINKMMLDINKSALRIDRLYTQYTSGKEIQNPSDNPIISSRALKFRVNVSSTEQYMRNVEQGLSWTAVTEEAFTNTNDILSSIRELCASGASDTLEYTDRQKIITEIATLVQQLGSEMNVQYTGRYVFSGYRADEPAIITENNENVSYNIYQTLNFSDVESVKQYSKESSYALPTVTDVYRLKLPYVDGVSNLSIRIDDMPITVTEISKDDPASYVPNPGEAHYIKETGELILDLEAVDLLEASLSGITINYDKKGLAIGDINPRVYFTCTETSVSPPREYDMDSQSLQFEFGINTRIDINNLSKDVYTAAMYADLMALCNDIANISKTNDVLLREKYSSNEYEHISEEERTELINNQLMEEEALYRSVMQDMYGNMLGIIDKHAAAISVEETSLGSRIVRLELIQNRLEADKVNYTDLMSANEDADYLEVIMDLSAAESVYEAALKVGSAIMQLSLADHIR